MTIANIVEILVVIAVIIGAIRLFAKRALGNDAKQEHYPDRFIMFESSCLIVSRRS